MYKLLIVDDEAIIREGIIRNVDFALMGIEVIGSCENGVEALEVVRNEKPDIIMTDINMPFMNGMELAEHVMEMSPLTKIIFLTGYDKFEYAHQAVKLKVLDYLVKPVLPRELTRVFDKVLNIIKKEENEYDSVSKLKEQLEEMKPVLRERFLNRLIKRPISTHEMKAKMAFTGVELLADYFACLVIEPVNVDMESDFNRVEMTLMQLGELIQEYLSAFTDAVSFITYNDQIVVIIGGDDREDVIETCDLLADKIDQLSQSKLSCRLGIGIGKVVRRLERISESGNTAADALAYKYFNGGGNIISYYDIEQKRGTKISLSSFAPRIHKEIKSGNKESINGVIETFFIALGSIPMPVENYYIHVQNILASIVLALEEMGIHYSDIFGEGAVPGLELHEQETLVLMQQWLKVKCDRIIDYIIEEREDYQTGQAKSAVQYIEAHYMDEDISLKKVCKELCMSVSYFSIIFKEETGTTFVDYLTRTRMEKAKELLRNTNKKTYEVAAEVGYKDSHYFSLVFKKNTGMTATAFRSSLAGV